MRKYIDFIYLLLVSVGVSVRIFMLAMVSLLIFRQSLNFLLKWRNKTSLVCKCIVQSSQNFSP